MSGVSSAKPYDIAKRTVWDAYQQVRANRGAAGIDDETIADFERDLSKNLYKLWNRMSSGSYVPPPTSYAEGTARARKTVMSRCRNARWSCCARTPQPQRQLEELQRRLLEGPLCFTASPTRGL